jgi:radical SAM protein with 4Fe4S-binding SPASM domain
MKTEFLFKLFEINLASTCNRACDFCPDKQSNSTSPIYLSPELQSKIINELTALSYSGTICLSGFSEPFLFPDLPVFLQRLRGIADAKITVNTNGDFLTKPVLEEICDSVDRLAISLYDGIAQEDRLRDMVAKSNTANMQIDFRDRYSSIAFVNNRGGALGISGPQIETTCFYPYYCMYVDWTGEVLFCPHNFHKKNIVGNLKLNSITDIWNGDEFNSVRCLMDINRTSLDACRNCNVNGRLEGVSEYEEWK